MTTSAITASNKNSRGIFERRESAVRSYARNFPVKFVKAQGETLLQKTARNILIFSRGVRR